MKVEKLIGAAPYSTLADLKNAASNDFFTHKITFDYTDFNDVTNALTKTINPKLYKNASGAEKGLLKGVYVADFVFRLKTNFSGLSNIQTNGTGAVIDIGISGDGDKLIDAEDTSPTVSAIPLFKAFADEGDGDAFGFIVNGDTDILITLTCAVSSGSDKLNALTAGEAELYLKLVNVNDLVTEGAWATVTL